MKVEVEENLATEQRIALAHMQSPAREMLAGALALDRRLARIASHTGEPLLAQIGLAWWRDSLSKPMNERPSGDQVLDDLGRHWQGREQALQGLIDGWENVLGEEPLADGAARRFAEGRAGMFLAVAEYADCADSPDAILDAARRWALADTAAHVSRSDERAMLVVLGLEQGTRPAHLPRPLRGLAVLDALARRALRRGGRPLMDGRGAALCALRAGLLGR